MTEPGTQRAGEGGEPRVLTIPSGCAFLPTLVDALGQGEVVPGLTLDSPLWADATIYLPTQRAARAFAALLAERSTGRAALLPRIVPLGETDDAEFELATGAFEDADTLRPPIPPLERRLILTRLIQAWSRNLAPDLHEPDPQSPFRVPSSPADAVRLAGDLERLMDALTREGVPWDDVASVVETDYSRYFSITLDFLRIAAEHWPDILAGRDTSDPAKRQADLIGAEARRLLRDRPAAPIIAAGSTGSVPATAGLLAAIARMPRGAVVLQGLDLALDDESWATIGEDGEAVHGHPQAVMHRLLAKALQMPRSAVRALGRESPGAAARAALLAEALRPADTTDRWAEMPTVERARLADEGTRGLAVVEAADEREEALAIALTLREVVEEPGRTAALVTPDRGLAGRVAAELRRWGVEVDDSAGQPLTGTPAGRLALLAAEAAAEEFHPRALIALFAHPGVRLGLPRHEVERAAAALEIGALRGPAPAKGLAGIAAALAHARGETSRRSPRPRRRLADADWDLAAGLVERLARAFEPLTSAAEAPDLLFLAEAHALVVEALRRPGEGEDLDQGPDARALACLFDDLGFAARDAVAGRLADYPAFFAALAGPVTVPSGPRAGHRRIKILGLLEARLVSVDRVVLGGLDEGVWPPRAETDAFLNRPMRAKLGLSPPERRIGQTAHDWVQALGCPDAVITRARKRDSSPLVASRFLQRLKSFVGEVKWTELLLAGERYRGLAAALDAAQPSKPVSRPAPRPDPALFPRSLSVTEVETLVRDPYAIFARHVLKLDPLDPVALVPSAAERGTLIHQVLAEFARLAPGPLPPNARDELMRLGREAFAPLAGPYPELQAEWWPRFEKIAKPFLAWEAERRPALRRVHAELRGEWSFPLPTGEVFTLRARADRIEQAPGGGSVVDYKTGQPPSAKEVFAGFAPQLTLQAAMLLRGGFERVATAESPGLIYVHASGGKKPFEPKEIKPPKGDLRRVEDLIAEHESRFQSLAAAYATGERAYLSRPYPKFAKRYSPYDHLARVKEWSLASAGTGEDTP